MIPLAAQRSNSLREDARRFAVELRALCVPIAAFLLLVRVGAILVEVDTHRFVRVVSQVLAWLVLGGLALGLADVLEALRERRLTLLRSALTWSGPLVVLVLLLAGGRMELAGHLGSSEVRWMTPASATYVPTEFHRQFYAEDLRVGGRWLERWQSGELLALEIGVLFALAAAVATLGRRWGRRATLPALVLVLGGILSAAIVGDLLWMTYDLFHLGLLLGFLAIDLSVLSPLSLYGVDAVSAAAWLVLALSQASLLRRLD